MLILHKKPLTREREKRESKRNVSFRELKDKISRIRCLCVEMRIYSLFTNEKNVTEKSVLFSVTVVSYEL